jgi:hypothetical protein
MKSWLASAFCVGLMTVPILSMYESALAAGQENLGCPFKTIEDFLQKYAANVELQRKYTKFPLIQSHVEEGDSEPKVVTKKVNSAEAKIPIIPRPEKSKEIGLNQKSITKISTNRWELKLSKKDTDFKLRFIVEKESCYQVIESHDDSL